MVSTNILIYLIIH